MVRKLYAEGNNKGVVGPHELELTGTSLVERHDFGASVSDLSAIDRIASTYTFIYLTSVTGHVIPRDKVVEGDYVTFIEAVRDALDHATERNKEGVRKLGGFTSRRGSLTGGDGEQWAKE